MPTQNEDSPQPVGRRLDVLRALKAVTTPLSIVQIADQLAVHPNTVRFHLDRLIENGQVERTPPDRSRPGRPPLRFRAVRGMEGPQIVCPVHLGLMQGAMDAWDAPITVDRLHAIVEPDLCLASLAPAGAVQ